MLRTSALLSRAAFIALPLAAFLLVVPSAKAQDIQVVAPNALAAIEGNANLSTLDNAAARTYQTQIAASQLTGFAIGDQISSISFRLDNSSPLPPVDLTFARYQVVLSQAVNSIANFNLTFANNIGANAATVYDDALTFTRDSYQSGAFGTTPNDFGPTITFSSAYTYQGGDLVITIRHSGNGVSSSVGNGVNSPGLDAITSSAQGFGTALVGQSATSENATTATSQNFATVLRLEGTAVAAAAPEPGTIALLLSAGVPVAGLVRRRKK